jgi:predicted CopG family antitoxin
MATKTISLSLDAYDRLRLHRIARTESFSHVVLRARWPEETVTAAELLERWRKEPAFLTNEECDAIEEAKVADRPPEDKWNKP